MYDAENSGVSPLELDDTQPIGAQNALSSISRSRQRVGWFCLLGAVVFTVGTIVVLAIPVQPPADNFAQEPSPTSVAIVPTSVEAGGNAQLIPETSDEQVVELLPTLSPEDAARLLSTPPIPAPTDAMVITRNVYNPFTFIPDRPRAEVVQYTAVAGDTIAGIAERFGLQRETVAWSNPRSYVQILQPGNVLNILPVDGVLHTVLVEQTIASVAEQYGIDPYAIIDSDFNDLFGATPETLLSSNTSVVVPGGSGEQIVWSPQVIRVAASGGSGSSGGGQISFSPGDPGSCGLVDNPGGAGNWVRPLNGYTWIRGYASWHPAADLAVSEGTPVYAASSGRVIFAGWNTFGYGYAVVIAHGPFTTIYAHLSAISVGCGQDVSAGQQIAASGNTGNSSGPHLHFEMRYNDVPQDPTLTVAL
jgi:murein DD-endopeptidase MepM/ murein hydrolase activator NlpD